MIGVVFGSIKSKSLRAAGHAHLPLRAAEVGAGHAQWALYQLGNLLGKNFLGSA